MHGLLRGAVAGGASPQPRAPPADTSLLSDGTPRTSHATLAHPPHAFNNAHPLAFLPLTPPLPPFSPICQAEELYEQIQSELHVAMSFRERVIPEAVRFFTGEASDVSRARGVKAASRGGARRQHAAHTPLFSPHATHTRARAQDEEEEDEDDEEGDDDEDGEEE